MVVLPFCHITLKAKIPIKGYPETPSTIGEHIKKKRIDLGLFQKNAAHQLGVSNITLSNWETNKRTPQVRYLPKIIDFLEYYPYEIPNNTTGQLVAARHHLGLSQK